MLLMLPIELKFSVCVSVCVCCVVWCGVFSVIFWDVFGECIIVCFWCRKCWRVLDLHKA